MLFQGAIKMLTKGDITDKLVYLSKKLVGLQHRLNITDEHMMRLMEVDALEWAEIVAIAKSKSPD